MQEQDFCEGEIYICVDQAKRQALQYNVSVENECARLVAHGIYHLLGYTDETFEKRSYMKMKEDSALNFIFSNFSENFINN